MPDLFAFPGAGIDPKSCYEQGCPARLPEKPEDFARYCAEGMRTILTACPEIRGVQLRVNLEAGVHVDPDADSEDQTNTAEEFWNTMVDAIASVGRPIRLDIRAKGLTEGLLDPPQRRQLQPPIQL